MDHIYPAARADEDEVGLCLPAARALPAGSSLSPTFEFSDGSDGFCHFAAARKEAPRSEQWVKAQLQVSCYEAGTQSLRPESTQVSPIHSHGYSTQVLGEVRQSEKS